MSGILLKRFVIPWSFSVSERDLTDASTPKTAKLHSFGSSPSLDLAIASYLPTLGLQSCDKSDYEPGKCAAPAAWTYTRLGLRSSTWTKPAFQLKQINSSSELPVIRVPGIQQGLARPVSSPRLSQNRNHLLKQRHGLREATIGRDLPEQAVAFLSRIGILGHFRHPWIDWSRMANTLHSDPGAMPSPHRNRPKWGIARLHGEALRVVWPRPVGRFRRRR